MKIEANYESISKFFIDNEKMAEKKFKDINIIFINTFNEVLNISKELKPDVIQKRMAVALALYLRASKYLFTSYRLSLTGHTEESRILLRNSIELLMLGFLIFKKEEVYSLWLECHDLRLKNTYKSGEVDMNPAQIKRYWIRDISRKYSDVLESNKETSYLNKLWKEFSMIFSHENLYNIAVRTELKGNRTEIYIGDGYSSTSKRMKTNLNLIIEIMKNVLTLVKLLKAKS